MPQVSLPRPDLACHLSNRWCDFPRTTPKFGLLLVWRLIDRRPYTLPLSSMNFQSEKIAATVCSMSHSVVKATSTLHWPLMGSIRT